MLSAFREIFQRTTEKISGHPAPLVQYIYLFFAILAVRLTLEFFSSHRLFSFPDVVHIGLWFMFIVLAFMVQLHLFSGVSMEKLIRLCVVGFSIALSAPVIDLLVSGGQGAKMNYLSLNSWRDVGIAYFTAGGPSLSRGATLGIRIEIGLLIISCFTYIYQNTHNRLRAIVGSLSIYTVLFLSGAVPRILAEINRLFSLQYAQDDTSTSLFLLLLDVMLLLFVLYRLRIQRIVNFPAAPSMAQFGLGVLLFTAGARMAEAGYPENWSLNPSTLFWFPLLFLLSLLFGAWYSNGYNFHSARYYLVPALVCTALISLKGMFLCAGLWGILYLRDSDPLTLGQYRIMRLLLKGMFACGVALSGYVFWGAPMVGFPANLIWAILAGAIGGNISNMDITHLDGPDSCRPEPAFRITRLLGSILFYAVSCCCVFSYIGNIWVFLFGSLPLLPVVLNARKTSWYVLAFYPLALYCLYRIA